MICSNELTLDMIESRISKHPNIKNHCFQRCGNNKNRNFGKNPFAVASNGKEMFLVDDQFSLYNLKKDHKDIDIPVITGLSTQLGTDTFGKDDLKDLKIAQYIISQSIKINKSLYNYISEINFADSTMIVLVTSDDATPVYFVDYYSLANKTRPEAINVIRDINNNSLRKAIDSKLVQLNGF